VRRLLPAVAAGVLVQAALLAAISGMPHHHPSTGTLAFRAVSVGGIDGFVAAVAADGTPFRAGAASGSVAGVSVGAGFWWLLFYGDTVGVFHHVHYVVATSGPLLELGRYFPEAVAAGVSLVVAAAFAAGGTLGGYAASRRP